MTNLYIKGLMTTPPAPSLFFRVLPLLGFVFAALWLSSCKSKEKTGTPLAKVGESTLTLEDVRRTFPQEYEQALPREQYLDFVKRWIDDEVIFQQALKAGLEQDSNVALRIEDMRRKLLIEEFMAREGEGESVEPDEAALTQYYEVHREEFRRKHAVFKPVVMRMRNLKEALEVKPKLRGADYAAQVAPYLVDSLPEVPEAVPFRKAQELRPCLQAAVAGAQAGQVLGPLTCPEGVVLVKIADRAEAGSLVAFADVRDHIAGMLMMERKSKQREGTIARYKEGALITFNLDKIPGRDTPPEEAESESSGEDTYSARGMLNAPNTGSVDMAASSPGTMRQGNAARPRARPSAESASPTSQQPSSSSTASGSTGTTTPAETQTTPRGESSASPVSDTVSHESP
jgi:peptidyl-prolyl cis-trans isomerase C